jgi:hypothetical protein
LFHPAKLKVICWLVEHKVLLVIFCSFQPKLMTRLWILLFLVGMGTVCAMRKQGVAVKGRLLCGAGKLQMSI